jgi:hypothetical protein
VVGDVLWRVTDGHYQLVVPADRGLRELILKECHDNPASGHLGQAKTFERVYRRFYWDGMRAEVKNYVIGCNRCQLTKVGGQKPKGYLHSIEPPTRCWSSISMDFVTGLALTARGYDAVVTFTDKFSKMVHLIPLKFNQSGAPQVARIFVDQIWRLHGAPLEILSDRDTRFTSSFWQEVYRLIGVKVKMTTAYRPQGDGQSENTNRTMEQILRAYTNNRQTDWDLHLAACEFAVNDAVHQGTKHSPFSLVYGSHGQPMSQLDLYLESAKSKLTGNPAAGNFVEKWRNDLIDARHHMVQAQDLQAKYYNRLHDMVEHAVGDKVLVSSKSITAPTDRDTKWKLRDQWYGPLTIIERLQPSDKGPVTTYRLRLPHQWKVHDTFSVDKLKPYVENDDKLWKNRKSADAPQTQTVAGYNEYVVERILGHRDIRVRRGALTVKVRQWLVRWKGFDATEDQWLREEKINTADMKNQLWELYEAELKNRRDDIAVAVADYQRAHESVLQVSEYGRPEAVTAKDRPLRVLVLFCGTGSVERAAVEYYPKAEIVSVDNDPTSAAIHVTTIRAWVNGPMRCYPPGYFDIIWASPPCTQYSYAKTIGKRDFLTADANVKDTFKAIDYLKPAHFFVENPRGHLRQRPFMHRRRHLLHTVCYCKYGTPNKKPTNIWTRTPDLILKMCDKNTPCRYKHEHGVHRVSSQSGPSKNGTPGSGKPKNVYPIPSLLVKKLFEKALHGTTRAETLDLGAPPLTLKRMSRAQLSF